jgi:arginine decarboxylase
MTRQSYGEMFTPKELFFTKGVGRHREKLASFELALRDAHIAEFNLVRVSSIYPPQCKIVSATEGRKKLKAGQILFVVLAESATNEPNRLIASSIGVAIPRDKSKFGYLSEHHAYGITAKKAADYAEDLAAMMLASTLGIEYDEDITYDARRDLWKLNKDIVRTRSISQAAVGSSKGLWKTVVSGAVLIL